MITAPYNFVPLNKEVFYPSWSDEVNHDVPFEDGESGEVEITIESKSPIYIRNHYQDGDEYYLSSDGKKIISKEFCHLKQQDGSKQYYIPGSSIKGMIRSVLEIMTFSKIKIDEENLKKTLSVRDMSNRQKLVGTSTGCGFLVEKDGSYYVQDCGSPLTISFFDVRKAIGVDTKRIETAKEKYKKIGIVTIPIIKEKKEMNVRGRLLSKNIAKYDSNSNTKGQLVFTGSITNKKNEFVFISNNKMIPISTEIVEGFKKVYFHESSTDGMFWKSQFKQDINIPIFYAKDRNTQEITAIGLTQLFKLAYKKTLLDASKQDVQASKLDFSETLFGAVSKDFALKGRVQFSHLKSTHVTYEKEKSEILGSPNPTYYPNYIQQNGKNGIVRKYTTLMDAHATISGYKRYPLHSTIKHSHKTNDNEKITTKFKPLNSGTIFKGKIRFHNLKKAEIGALLSAITFHGQSSKYLHNIGMGKPLGYGKIEIKVACKNLKFEQSKYLDIFEQEIAKNIDNWQTTPQLKELFAMASVDVKDDKLLKYQQLENSNRRNDFTEAKKDTKYLAPYSLETKHSSKQQPKKPNYKNTKKPFKVPTPTQHEVQIGISKTKIRKTIASYWKDKFGISYHPNQIKEFLSQDGFITTPSEQAKIYIENKNNEEFVGLINLVKQFNDGAMDENLKEKFYKKLTKELVEA